MATVNTGVKVHQRIAVKIHQPEGEGSGVWSLAGGARGGFSPLAAPERSNFALVAEAVLAGCSRLIVTDAALAMFEPKAVAVHLENVNVVGEAIEQRAG